MGSEGAWQGGRDHSEETVEPRENNAQRYQIRLRLAYRPNPPHARPVTEEIIGPEKVVGIDYVLTDPSGAELDRSTPERPLLYLHGAGNIVPGLEEGLVGLTVGDTKAVRVPPEKGYGRRQKLKPHKVLRSKFPPEANVTKGAQFMMQGPEGRPMPIWITKVQGRQVHVTPQHPLAGVTLCFEVTVRDIRPATEEEKAHGHPHGPGGHHHHDEEE